MIKYLSSQSLKKFSGKTCLLRIDLNVELGMPIDSYRLEAVVPTIKLLLKNNVRVILMSHRGRPKGFDKELSLKPFASIFARKLGVSVHFISTLDLVEARKEIMQSDDKMFLLENLRFWPGEESNDLAFARQLASVGDFYPHTKRGSAPAASDCKNPRYDVGVYVNDAFAVSHRADASIAAITKFLPSYAGLLLEKEIKNLDRVMKDGKHPLTVIIGGAKVSDKLGVVRYFWKRADDFLIGGSPANTFLEAEGMDVGDSLVDTDAVPIILPYLNAHKIHLPEDARYQSTKILDVGPKTVKEYTEIIRRSKTIIWNGPMGWFEHKEFGNGTKGIWKAVLGNKKAHIVVGGGETVSSARLIPNSKFQIPNSRNIFLSTGGGAMLEYLSGRKLPGLEALKKSYKTKKYER